MIQLKEKERGERMKVAYRSDIGRQRNHNQDYTGCFLNRNRQPLLIVCDGMGGHNGGDVASEMAVSHMGAFWKDTSLRNTEQLSIWFSHTIQKVNRLIYQRSKEFHDLAGMGTTLVAASVIDGEVVIAHVGDSRAYLYRRYLLEQLTEDHSLVNEFVKSGEITAEEAKLHPRKNVVTRSVGTSVDVEVDIVARPFAEGDMLLLCSDGLINMLEETRIVTILKEWLPLEEKVEALISAANEAGGLDNISVLLASGIEEGRGGA